MYMYYLLPRMCTVLTGSNWKSRPKKSTPPSYSSQTEAFNADEDLAGTVVKALAEAKRVARTAADFILNLFWVKNIIPIIDRTHFLVSHVIDARDLQLPPKYYQNDQSPQSTSFWLSVYLLLRITYRKILLMYYTWSKN